MQQEFVAISRNPDVESRQEQDAHDQVHAQSLATYQKIASLFGENPFSRTLHSLILAMVGKSEEAKRILSELKKHAKLDSFSLIYLAETCSVMGDKNGRLNSSNQLIVSASLR
jgi:predicted Zn-dependent protease